MIRLSKTNYFTGEANSVASAVSKIVQFLEVEGTNPIFFTPEQSSVSKKAQSIGKSCMIVPRIEFKGIMDFEEKIADRGLMFRASLIVLDFWHLDRAKIEEYKKIVAATGLDCVIMAKEYIYKEGEDVSDFHVVVKYEEGGSSLLGFKSQTTIHNKIDGWKSNLEDLKKTYIRDKKIDGLLGGDDC